MSSHVYHEIFLHLNWHTKFSMPLLNPALEERVYARLTERIAGTEGAWLHGIGGTATHVHLAISIEPSVTPVPPAKAGGKEKKLADEHPLRRQPRSFGKTTKV